MKFMSARDAKNEFGLLLDTARAEPVTIEKHGRPVVVVLAVEEFGRLTAEKLPGAGATKMDSLPGRPDRAGKTEPMRLQPRRTWSDDEEPQRRTGAQRTR